jgi:uncharacterized hydrophobic protein (TIGR00271 family)
VVDNGGAIESAAVEREPMTTPVSESSDVEDRPSVQHQGALEIAQIMAAQGRFSLFERQRILGVLLPRQDAAAIIRFSIMLALSVAIAVMGLSADSSAVVIGAMLVAPLMSPIFTFSAAVGLGLPRRAGQAALIVALGSAGSVLLAIALAQMLPDVDLSAEVLSRTSPDVRDLVVAIAAGAAGAYATTRQDVSAALPGVAVAVALLPPLAATGIVLQQGRGDLAEGSLLLFVTNLTAIVVTSLIVFLATGVIPTIRLCLRNRRLAATVLLAVATTVAVGIPLTARSVDAAESARTREQVTAEVAQWLGNRDLDVDEVRIDGTRVSVDVRGPDEPPAAFELARSLVDQLGDGVEVEVRWSQQASGVARADAAPADSVTPMQAVVEVVEGWLESSSVDGARFELLDTIIAEDEVELVVGGPEPPPRSETLADDIAEALARSTTVTVRWVQQLDYTDGSETIDQQITRLATAWVGPRNLVRVLDVGVREDQVVVDLASAGDPLGVDVLVELVQSVLPEVTVDVRSVPLRPLELDAVDQVPVDLD